MNPDSTYQNQDLNSNNPLLTEASSTLAKTPTSNKFQLPQDPKIKILIILGIIVLMLSILSGVIFVVKKNSTTTQTPIIQPTPTAVVIVEPTITTINPNIPENIRNKFEQIDKNNQVNPSFDPPQIDTTIGQ